VLSREAGKVRRDSHGELSDACVDDVGEKVGFATLCGKGAAGRKASGTASTCDWGF